jgi:translocation and assembly module TamA
MILNWCVPVTAQTNLKSKTGITVKSEIAVNLPDKINSWLKNIVKDSEIESTKYKNTGELNTKVDELEHTLLRAMHAKGYYSAQVKSKIKSTQKHGERKVLFNIFPGELYILTEIQIKGDAKGIKVPEIQNLGLKLNTPLEAKKVLAAENIFRNHVESLNCLVSIDASYQAVLDDDKAEALLIFKVKPAPQAKFGAVEFKGLTTVDADFVAKKLKWKQGDCFKLNLIERT